MPVDGESRKGLVALEDQLHRLACLCQSRIVERPPRKDRRVSRRQQYGVPLPQRNTEPLAKMEHHLAAGPRPARFDEAQMPRGNIGCESQIELAHAAPLAPLAKVLAKGRGRGSHRRSITAAALCIQ